MIKVVEEIKKELKKTFYIDDNDMWKYKKHLIQCTQADFTINEYMECLRRWS